MVMCMVILLLSPMWRLLKQINTHYHNEAWWLWGDSSRDLRELHVTSKSLFTRTQGCSQDFSNTEAMSATFLNISNILWRG